MGQARVFSRMLSDADLDAHAFNIENVADSMLLASGSAMSLYYALNENLTSLSGGNVLGITDLTQNNLSGTIVNVAPFTIPYQSYLVDYSFLSPTMDLKWSENKVRIRNASSIALDNMANDNNQVTLEFNLTDALNEDIAKIFSTMDSMNNIIGNPVNKYRDSYHDLEAYRSRYFSKLTDSLHFTRFFKLFQWFDKKLGTSIKQLLPARTDFIGGEFVVESHMLERNKYQYQYPVFHTPKTINDASMSLGDTDGHFQTYLTSSTPLEGTYVASWEEAHRSFKPPQASQNFGIRVNGLNFSYFANGDSARIQIGDEDTTWYLQNFDRSPTNAECSDEIVYTTDGVLISPDWPDRVDDGSVAGYFPDYSNATIKSGARFRYKVSASITPGDEGFQASDFTVFMYDYFGSSTYWESSGDTTPFSLLTPIESEPGWYQYDAMFTGSFAPEIVLADVVSNNWSGGIVMQVNVQQAQYYFSDVWLDFSQSLTPAGDFHFYPQGVAVDARPTTNVIDADLMPQYRMACNDQRERFEKQTLTTVPKRKVSGDTKYDVNESTDSVNYKNEFSRKILDRYVSENRDGSKHGFGVPSSMTNGFWSPNESVFANIDSHDSELHYHGLRKTMNLALIATWSTPFGSTATGSFQDQVHSGSFLTFGSVQPGLALIDKNNNVIQSSGAQYFQNWIGNRNWDNATLSYEISGNIGPVLVSYADGGTNFPFGYGSPGLGFTYITVNGAYTAIPKRPGWYKYREQLTGKLTPQFDLSGFLTGSAAGFNQSLRGFSKIFALIFRQPLQTLVLLIIAR
jgi:hypothetical protein